MKDESARDKAIEHVLAQKLRATATAGNGCPDAEIIAAYFERTLAPKERTRWEAHFDTCAQCQHRIAALVRMDEAGEASMAKPVAKLAPQLKKRSVLRWAWAAPVLLVVLVAGLWYTGEFDQVLNRRAETRRPAPQTVATPPNATATAVNKQEGATSTAPISSSKANLSASLPKSSAPTSTTDELKKSTNAPAPPESAGKLNEAQALSAAPPAMDTGAERKDKESVATPGATVAGGAGAPAQVRTEAGQPTAIPSTSQQVAGEAASEPMRGASELKSPGANSAGAAGREQNAPSPSAPSEIMAMKRSRTDDGAQAETAQMEKNQKTLAAGDLFARPGGLQALVRTPGVRYTSAPGVVSSDGVTAPAALWRVGAHGLIQKQTAQGEWETRPSGVVVDLLDIAFPTHEVGWAVGQDGTVLRSANAGESWGRVASPTSEDLVRVRATSAESAEVTTRSGEVFVTADGAATWTKPETAH